MELVACSFKARVPGFAWHFGQSNFSRFQARERVLLNASAIFLGQGIRRRNQVWFDGLKTVGLHEPVSFQISPNVE